MIMELTYLLLNKVNIADWSPAQLEYLNELSQAEIDILHKNVEQASYNSVMPLSSSWR
ncbi:MAG: hypothetical protein ABS939_01665 [Psychrobacillus sp.]